MYSILFKFPILILFKKIDGRKKNGRCGALKKKSSIIVLFDEALNGQMDSHDNLYVPLVASVLLLSQSTLMPYYLSSVGCFLVFTKKKGLNSFHIFPV